MLIDGTKCFQITGNIVTNKLRQKERIVEYIVLEMNALKLFYTRTAWHRLSTHHLQYQNMD